MFDTVARMKADGYRAYHESLTSNNTGTTAFESTLVVLPSLLCLYVLAGLQALRWIPLSSDRCAAAPFAAEFVCTIMPCILSFTVGSDYVIVINWSMVAVGIMMSSRKLKKPWLSCYAGSYSRKEMKAVCSYQLPEKPRSFITNFRTITNVLTVLSILAVDFHIFPRRFAKTETFGYGVMDLGVGLFIIANALVAPEVRSSKPVSVPLSKTMIETLPLILLGMGRLIMTNQVDYQKHVTEYGQHWNFFFTLAVTKIMCSVIIKFVKQSTEIYLLLFVFVTISYEIVLFLGVQEWILSDAPRLDFISANREGLASILGYIALYFGGVALARFIRKHDCFNVKSNLTLAKILAVIAAISWSITLLSDYVFGVSRRLANVGYIFWIMSFTVTVITIELIVEAVVILLKVIGCKKPDENILFVPKLFEAINRNGLLFFLLGNVLTGLFNIAVKTFTLNSVTSFVVITVYMLLNCFAVTILNDRNIIFKF